MGIEENKKKIFQDATQGYIQIPSNMVKNLIDTFEMQRLKDVAQTGIRSIYSGATHDRFSHSIGVYSIGTRIYNSFRQNLLEDLKGCGIADDYVSHVTARLEEYEYYYYTACILHDIGHPALSHTFEYIYDSRYLSLNNAPIDINEDEVKRLYDTHSKRTAKDTPLKAVLKQELHIQSNSMILTDEIRASQHEMMGAYLILTDASIQAMIGNYLRGLLKEENYDYAFIASMIVGAQYKLPEIGTPPADMEKNKNRLDTSLRNCIIHLLNGMIDADSIDYLNRNTHFAGYSTSKLDVVRLCNAFSAHFDPDCWSFESCMEKSAMSALEGFVSARNYEPRWLYSHHKIVYYEAFLVKYLYKKCARYLYALDQPKWDSLIQKVFVNIDEVKRVVIDPYQGLPPHEPLPSWERCLSEFRSALLSKCPDGSEGNVRLISHISKLIKGDQKAEFADEQKEEFEKAGNRLRKGISIALLRYYKMRIPAGQEAAFAKAIMHEKDRLLKGEKTETESLDSVRRIAEAAKKWAEFCTYIRESYYGYLMSPVGEYRGFSHHVIWYKTSDSDINTLFKQLYLHYRELEEEKLSDAEREVNDRYDLFQSVLEEYHTHQYRQSLWKTEEEYDLFLSEIEKRTSLPREIISRVFIDFIIENGFREEFDDPVSFDKKNKQKYKAVYFNWASNPAGDDYKKRERFNRLFAPFGAGLVICIYGFHYKDFGKLRIRFKTGKGAELVPYSNLVGDTKREDEYLPYIYYTGNDSEFNDKSETECAESLRDHLKREFINYLLGMNEEKAMYTTSYQPAKGKIIRDSVHGDIFVPDRFLRVIDSKVFQRLRRIKQLSTADYVFPEANHTRFAHSLGTFHIMTMMMDRICGLFDYLHIDYSQDDRDVILMAALLHDVGHGPYSHAFEKLSVSGKSHEMWTREIIENDPELKEIFALCFGSNFAIRVTDCLQKRDGSSGSGAATLQNVFSALISSQLDADRLDYLMRDSFNTGVKLGVVDLQKIVASLELTQYNDRLSVCVSEDALSAVEQLIVGRFNMYDSVYFSPYKAFSEELMCRIADRISKDPDLSPDCLFAKIKQECLSLEDYIRLDDSVFQSELYQYQQCSSDSITREMITCFFNRCGYERLRIMDESPRANDCFLSELETELNICVDNIYGIINRVANYSAYDNSVENGILIVGKNGVISDLMQRSKIVGRSKATAGEAGALWDTIRSVIYVNYNILRQEKDLGGESINVEKMKKMVDSYSLRKHTEIEEKYSCGESAVKRGRDAETILIDPRLDRYMIDGEPERKLQEDVYYDTEDYFLAKNESSLRCRTLPNGRYTFTVKQSIDPNNRENGGQFIRSEFELEATSPALDASVWAFVSKHLSELFAREKRDLSLGSFKPTITVRNDRTSYNVRRKDSDFWCEVSLDAVTYQHDCQERQDWQIEIELKSLAPIHRIELKSFAEKYREVIGVASRDKETLSKYEKALNAFRMRQ